MASRIDLGHSLDQSKPKDYRLKCQVIGTSGSLDVTAADLALLLGEEYLRRALDLAEPVGSASNFQVSTGTITTTSQINELPGGVWLELATADALDKTKSLKIAVKLGYEPVREPVGGPARTPVTKTQSLRQFLANEDQLQQQRRYDVEDELGATAAPTSLLGPPKAVLDKVLQQQDWDGDYGLDDHYGSEADDASDAGDVEDSKYF